MQWVDAWRLSQTDHRFERVSPSRSLKAGKTQSLECVSTHTHGRWRSRHGVFRPPRSRFFFILSPLCSCDVGYWKADWAGRSSSALLLARPARHPSLLYRYPWPLDQPNFIRIVNLAQEGFRHQLGSSNVATAMKRPQAGTCIRLWIWITKRHRELRGELRRPGGCGWRVVSVRDAGRTTSEFESQTSEDLEWLDANRWSIAFPSPPF